MIAASIAAQGFSTILPWPAASCAGLSARSSRAVSRAVGRCQVEVAGSGKRGLGFAVVATPPSVVYASPEIERAVAGVEEDEVAGRVAGRGDDLERADPLARRDLARRPRVGAG